MGLPACNRRSQSAEQKYRDARLTFQRGDLATALAAADAGIARYQERNPDWAYRFRILKAEVSMWRGQSREALALLDPDVPASLASDEISTRRRMAQGLANAFVQNFDKAESQLAEAEQLAATRHSGLLGEVALSRGVVAILRSNSAVAEASFRRALQVARDEKQPFLEANALSNLGLVYMRRQQYGEAIDWFNASRKLAEPLGNRTLTSKVSGNLGWSYFKLGDYETALSLFTESEALAGQLGLDRDRLVWLTNIGSVHYEKREFPDAERYYQSALTIARKLDNKSSMAVCLNNLAATALETQQYELAEQYNHEALQLKRSIGDPASELYSALNDGRIAAGRKHYADASELFERVVRDSGKDVSLRWEAEADLANVYAAQGKSANAEQHFRAAIATVDTARQSLAKEEHRLSFLTSATRFYNDYIDFLVSHGRAREALQVAEHSRARTLAEGLGLGRSAALLPAAFRPEQTAERLNTVMLSYWLKPGHSYLWVVTKSKTVLFPLPPEAEITAAVQAYRKALVGPRDVLEAANPSGRQLYDMLVSPAQALIPRGARVAVVADGSLSGLNFETLLVPAPKLHYWIEDAVITNANSLALLAASGRNRAAATNLLLIGNPVSATSEFPELTQAKVEIDGVQKHFASSQRTVIAGPAASPRAYSSSEPGKFAYIHFVAHGTASRTSPLDSGVILSRDGEAYKLYARDIMQQPLRAELVTISACYGAGTRAYSGEGLVGLSWAFLRAGAHNVIAALWEVNDASTPNLMDGLYKELSQGRDPAVALRTAKLAMLHSDGVYRRPFYWAAFQVYTGS